MTISSRLNFVSISFPAPPERGLRRGENFWLGLTTASAQCLRLSGRFFHLSLLCVSGCLGVWVRTPDLSDLKLNTVAVLDTVSPPNDFGLKRSMARVIGLYSSG